MCFSCRRTVQQVLLFTIVFLIPQTASGQPAFLMQPQPIRSIFTDYLDSWTHFVNSTLNNLPPHLAPINDQQHTCLVHLHQLVSAATHRKPWAMKMFDSMGKPTSGIMQESLSFLGFYSECVHSHTDEFGGQYCLANVILPQSSIEQLQKLSGLSPNSWTNTQARIGLCFPSTCQLDQINSIGNYAISQLISNSSISLSNCYQRDGQQPSTTDSMYLVVFLFLGLFVALVTFATYYEHRVLTASESPCTDDKHKTVCINCSHTDQHQCLAIEMGVTALPSQSKPASKDLLSTENNNSPSHLSNGCSVCDTRVSNHNKPRSQPEVTLSELLAQDLFNVHSQVKRTSETTGDCTPASTNPCPPMYQLPPCSRSPASGPIVPGNTCGERLLLCFSALNNFRRLFNVDSSSAEDSINCLHGIKFLCMMWIISGHSYSFAMQWLFFSNPNKIKEASTHLMSQIFANGTFSVDCFFFISGLLVCLLGLKAIKANGGRLNVGVFYLHRYLRLTPLMLIVIAFSSTIFRTIAEGPVWLESITMYDGWCRQNWWINALYLHNFVNREQMCLSHSWYSAVDMQFYLISPILLIALARWPRFGLGILAFLFTISASITATLTAVNDYPAMPYIAGNVPQQVLNDYYGAIYIKPYCRIGPYLVGFFIGFLIHNKKYKVDIETAKHIFYSVLSVATLIFVLFAMQGANNGIKPPVAFAALYSALSRPLFCASLAYLILCFLSGKLSMLNSLLSLPLIRPLSRVSYAAYLLHPLIIAAFYGSREQVFYFSHYLMFYFIIGNLFITYCLSFVVTICFEMPFINMSRLMIRRNQSN